MFLCRSHGWQKPGNVRDWRVIDVSPAPLHLHCMTFTNLALLASSTIVFIGAASSAKVWALSANSFAWLTLTLALYTAGNLIMLRLVRDVGMGVALSLSAVVQLVAVNVVALAFFGERLAPVQAIGLLLAIASVAMITLGPARG